MQWLALPLVLIAPYLRSSLFSPSPCANLAILLPDKVFFPDSETYAASQRSYFALQEQQLAPACIVIPSSVEDVSVAVKTLADLPDSTFAIRSGGHSSVPGAANAHTGVTIDLHRLNDIHMNGDVVSIGSGALWTDVYDVLVPRGLAVVGGRTGNVGVGGLLTGGGLSAFSPHRGFACDNVVEMQVVLASGAIITSNTTHHPDLFAALKGGQNNFGVITRFDLATFPQADLWAGAIVYPASVDAAQLDAFRLFKNASAQAFDPHAQVELSFLFESREDSLAAYTSNNMFYTKPVVDAAALRVFSDIQPQMFSSMRVSNLSDFARELANSQPVGQFSIYATTTVRLSYTILPRIYEIWKNFTRNRMSSIPYLLSALTIQALPPIIPTSPNVLGFAPGTHPETDFVLLLVSNYWSDPAYSATMSSHTRALIEEIDAAAQSEGVSERFRYMNYADQWQGVLESYGRESVHELWRVSRKYDPQGVFQKKVPGGFKLPKAP
ncbi:FAD-binding domain-containing protein [Aspergillus sclerotioniger CBS 115572]|uniref:FAD-binding domain-containing protein n=1 Tax=Aspergillus sclerotioniger CBS 115572 TaxID=1450535 RepID=A0A317WHR0_9EURO|nr:FAD-binding domain-containing protein [Aspergillus sclerotioniger CBS 115572]PWY85809.1 FAD-binding domain-containing protein [Aspergillus sclerotioniger CBS 115572]